MVSPKYSKEFARECRAYVTLKGVAGVPHMLCSGAANGRHYIVIERVLTTVEEFQDDDRVE